MATPSSVLTQGLGSWGSVNLLVTLGFGSAEASFSATIVGVWRNPITIEATGPITIYAGNHRTTIEAGGTVDA